MKQSENIEQLFRDSLGNLEADVNPKVWNNIQSQITSNSTGNAANGLLSSLVSKVIVGVLGTAAVITAVVLISNTEETKTVPNKPVTVTENTVVKPELNKPTVTTNNPVSVNNSTDKQEVKSEAPVTMVPQHVEPIAPIYVPETPKHEAPVLVTPEPKHELPKVNNPEENPSGVSKVFAQIVLTPSNEFAPAVITLSDKGNGENPVWDFGDDSPNSSEGSPLHVYEKPGKYTITLTTKDEHGNLVIDTETIEVKGEEQDQPKEIFLPNSFSPNGDGINDEFRVSDEVNIVSFKIVVQDKTGKVVAQWSSFEGYWDGRNLKGEICPQGTYIYVLNYVDKLSDKRQKIGSITITSQR